jgi:hypothetical protein
VVCTPSNRWLSRLLFLGKYKTSAVKGVLTIALCGFPIDYSGPHIGVRHDDRLWMEDLYIRSRMFRWEYGLGDKAYVGCPELLTEYKKTRKSTRNLNPAPLTGDQVEWNLLVQHYRGRAEHLISELVQSRKALNTR